jgi:hypothetical protein
MQNVTADFRHMTSNISDHFTPSRLFDFNAGYKKNDDIHLDGYYATLLSEGSKSRSSVSQQEAPKFV